MLRLIKRMIQGFFIKHLGTDHISFVAIQESLNHARFRIFRHELLLKFFQILFHFFGKGKLILFASVNYHCFRPHLFNIGSGCFFIRHDVYLCIFGINHNRKKSAVSSTVKWQKIQCVGSAAKHALAKPIIRLFIIRNFIGFLLTAEERFYIFNAFCIGCGNHLRHFHNPMTLHFTKYIVILQLFQIICKPLVFYGKKTKERGLACSLTSHKTQHHLKLTSRAKDSVNGTQHKQLHRSTGIFVLLHSKEMVQGIFNTLLSIPHQTFQFFLNWMILVFIGND